MDNRFIESFNGKLRDECLNMHWFESLSEARAVIERCRVEYNEMRPHSSLGNRAPAAYVAELLGVGTSSRRSSVSDIMTGPKTGAGSSIRILALSLDRFQGGHVIRLAARPNGTAQSLEKNTSMVFGAVVVPALICDTPH